MKMFLFSVRLFISPLQLLIILVSHLEPNHSYNMEVLVFYEVSFILHVRLDSHYTSDERINLEKLMKDHKYGRKLYTCH